MWQQWGQAPKQQTNGIIVPIRRGDYLAYLLKESIAYSTGDNSCCSTHTAGLKSEGPILD